MADPTNAQAAPAVSRAFARKVRLSRLALVFERLWPRLWLLIGLGLLFALLSFTGIWPYLDDATHEILLGAFGLAAIVALVYAVRIPPPTREEAIRRIERRSGVPHRPATSYEDTLSSGTSSAATNALWQAHRERLARMIGRLRVGTPSPRADRFDPIALRGLILLLLVSSALLATGSLSDRLAAAFRFGKGDAGAPMRIDAWVTPPPYTALPPVLLSDGGQAVASDASAKDHLFQVPDRSLLTLRGLGVGVSGVALEVLSDGAASPVPVAAEKSKAGDTSNISEVRYEIRKSARIRALAGTRELGQWTFDVIPDQLPKITLQKEITGTPRGSMRVAYKAEDDYGVANAEVKVRQVKKAVDASKAWAQPKPLSGPRLPLDKPPVLALKIPRPGAKSVDTSTLLEIGEHPWAGQRVELWLEATDVAGQAGRSAPIEMILPARRFKNPLARALIEQRRKLAEDSRNRPMVVRALDALTMEPEGFITDTTVYLALRSIQHRLERQGSHAAIKESVDELWKIALQVEDGALSQAERALKDAQDRLSDAIDKGADDKEIQDAMAELKKRLNDYLNEMQKNAEKDNPSKGDQQQSDQQQELGQQDLDQMMKDLEKNARNGSREEAQKMLSEMRELMDRLQANNSPEARAEQKRAQQMMKKLNELSDLTGKQQQLMDETFGERRKQEGQGGSQDDPSGQGKQKSGKGQQGQGQGQPQAGQDGMQSDDQGGAQQGEGQQGQNGQNQGNNQRGKSSLEQRQQDLRNSLNKLKKDLEQMGAGDPDKLGKAEDAMKNAEDALKQNELDEAAQSQAEALDQMRQSAQQMAQQMQKNAQQRVGRGGNTPKDPMGRPQRAEGPDLGTSVKVPDAIDAQRAREILEELRKRSGESLRPSTELDYIDRLLKRF